MDVLLSDVCRWAKARGIFGARHGYLSEPCWKIMVDSISPPTLRQFFETFDRWDWKRDAISLDGCQAEWSRSPVRIITAEPRVNLASNMPFQHLYVLRLELERATKLWDDPLLFEPKVITDFSDFSHHISIANYNRHTMDLVELVRSIYQHTGLLAILWPKAPGTVLLKPTGFQLGQTVNLWPAVEQWQTRFPKLEFTISRSRGIKRKLD